MQMTLCCATCVGKAANCVYPNKVVVDNAADMESAVAVDHVCATYTGNRRGNSNFIEADVIPMDIDNDHSDNPADWITEDKMEELFGDVDYVLVPSRHHMLAKDGKSERPRYHAYFPIEKCTDAAQYTAMKTAIQKAYPFFDDNALDAARFLFGATTGDVIWHEGWMSIMEVVADTEPDAAAGKETRKRDGVGTLHQHQDQLIKQGMRPLKNSPCRKGRSVTIKRQTRAVAGSSSLRRA